VQGTRNEPVPLHLRNAPTGLMRALGYGKDYHYAHDDYDVAQTNVPENIAGHIYYRPGDRGDEGPIADGIKKRRPE
jgi:putative ATPase